MSDCTAKGVASWALAAAVAAVMAGVSSSSAGDDWVRPPALKPGDTIAFVAPSGPAEMPPLRRYAEILEKAGYKVLIPEGIVRDGKRSDDERADELNAVIRDPKVRAIFPARGGYGLTRIVDRIDYAALRKDPKIVTGFSDLTALHLAIARKARLVSFHAPMPMSHLWQGDRPEFAFEAASFRRAVFADQYGKGASGYTIAYPADGKPEKLVGGIARGRLLGGNLSLICATVGTPYAIEPDGAILVIEDTNEAPYRDRPVSLPAPAGGRPRCRRRGRARELRRQGPRGGGGDRGRRAGLLREVEGPRCHQVPGRPHPAQRHAPARRPRRARRRPWQPEAARRPRPARLRSPRSLGGSRRGGRGSLANPGLPGPPDRGSQANPCHPKGPRRALQQSKAI